ncbi:unnamed protein product [Cochlearia groenlandica]
MIISGYGIVIISLLVYSSFESTVHARPVVLVLSNDDLNNGGDDNGDGESSEFDEFGESEPKSEEELDPGSWRPIFEPDDSTPQAASPDDSTLRAG